MSNLLGSSVGAQTSIETPGSNGGSTVDEVEESGPPTLPSVQPTDAPPFMSDDSEVRKKMPVASGVLAYFPDALMCVSWISRVGNEKHNPGEPLHWAKAKSFDEPDAEVRHMLDHLRGLPPDPGLEPLGHLGHLASKAWRALAHLQRECDRVRAEHSRPVGE